MLHSCFSDVGVLAVFFTWEVSQFSTWVYMMSGASKDAALIVSRVSERTYKGLRLGRGNMGGPRQIWVMVVMKIMRRKRRKKAKIGSKGRRKKTNGTRIRKRKHGRAKTTMSDDEEK